MGAPAEFVFGPQGQVHLSGADAPSSPRHARQGVRAERGRAPVECALDHPLRATLRGFRCPVGTARFLFATGDPLRLCDLASGHSVTFVM